MEHVNLRSNRRELSLTLIYVDILLSLRLAERRLTQVIGNMQRQIPQINDEVRVTRSRTRSRAAADSAATQTTQNNQGNHQTTTEADQSLFANVSSEYSIITAAVLSMEQTLDFLRDFFAYSEHSHHSTSETSESYESNVPAIQTTSFKCVICLETSFNREPMCLNCGHIFCKACILRYIEQYIFLCPICNKQIHSLQRIYP